MSYSHQKLDPHLIEEKLKQVDYRCQWVWPDLDRCQNTMSLKFHHRTYERYGKERISDISVFCPVHHVIADLIRKRDVGQREDVINERFLYIVRNKFASFELEDGLKKEINFLKKTIDEFSKINHYMDTLLYLLNRAENGTINDEILATALFRLDCWLMVIHELCTELPGIDLDYDFQSRWHML